MESWRGLSYDSIMDMPSTKRMRMIERKSTLEKKRTAQHNSDLARARARSR